MAVDRRGGRAGGPDPRNPGVNPPGRNYDDTDDEDSGGRSSGGRNKPIGVPEDFRIPVQTQQRPGYYPHGYNYNTRTWGAGADPNAMSAVQMGPRYHEGDQGLPARYHPNTIIRLQERMHSVGLLGSFRRGIWDLDSANAYKDLLAYANYRGISADQAIREMEQSAESTGTLYQGGKIRFDPTTGEWVSDDTGGSTRAPLIIKQSDPMELEKVFDEAVINTLGVGWDKTRIQNMVRAYQDLEAQRQQEAYNLELSGGSVVEIPSPSSFAQSYAQSQDPAGAEKARFVNTAAETIPLLAQGAWGVG